MADKYVTHTIHHLVASSGLNRLSRLDIVDECHGNQPSRTH